MKKIAFLAIFFSFFGASFLSIDLGYFQLTPFRISFILLSFLLILNIMHKDFGRAKLNEKSILGNKRVQFLVLWLIYDAITVIWVKDYVRWGKSLVFIGIGLVSTIIFSKILKNGKDYISVFKSIEGAAIIYNIFGWYEVVTGNYLFYRPEKAYTFSLWKAMNQRIPVFISSNENEYAICLMIMFFASYIVSKQRKHKTFSRIMMISEAILIYLTNSRGVIMALMVGLATLIWIQFKNLENNKRNLVVRNILVISLFGVIAIFIYLWVTGKISLKFDEGGSDSFRIALILAGLKFLLETYLFGVGGGNIEYWMYHYAPEVSRGMYANIHSWWVEVLVSYGIIIFVLYLKYYFGMYLELINRNKIERNKTKKGINNGLIAYMTTFIITAMVSSSFLKVEWLWLFFGIVSSYLFNYENIYIVEYEK